MEARLAGVHLIEDQGARAYFPPRQGSNNSRGRALHNECWFADGKSETAAHECPEQCSLKPQVRRRVQRGTVADCPLPVDGNWTEQVPSMISVKEEDGHGKARRWGGHRAAKATRLTTRTHPHYPVCQSVGRGQLQLNACVTCTDPVSVLLQADWLSF